MKRMLKLIYIIKSTFAKIKFMQIGVYLNNDSVSIYQFINRFTIFVFEV